MKKVFVLSGSSGSGKTNALHTLALLLNGMPGKYVFNVTLSDALPTSLPVNYDCKYIFEEVATGRKIGISTGGDTAYVIDSAFDYFINNNCDIGFLASKSYGSSVNQVELRSNAVGVVPVYFWLIWSYVIRNINIVQRDVARQLESMI